MTAYDAALRAEVMARAAYNATAERLQPRLFSAPTKGERDKVITEWKAALSTYVTKCDEARKTADLSRFQRRTLKKAFAAMIKFFEFALNKNLRLMEPLPFDDIVDEELEAELSDILDFSNTDDQQETTL